MKLHKHQQKAVKESPDKWGLWFKMRVGKTPTAIRLVNARCKSALIICPKGLVSQWEKEIHLWSNTNATFLVISRDQFKKRFEISVKKTKKANRKNPKVTKTVVDCDLEEFDAVIIDEVHRGFGNYASDMFKCLHFYLKKYKTQYVWALSGTPFTGTSWSVYSYGKIFGKDWQWDKWSKEFFDSIQMGRARVPVAKGGKDSKLQKIIRRLGTVVDLKDVAEVVDDVDVFETFTLNARQKKEIALLDEDVPVVEYMKTHQLEQGALNSDGYMEELQFPIKKDERLVELANNYEKLIIVCKYKAQIRKVLTLFPERKVFTIWGENKEQSSVTAGKAEAEENCIVIVQGDTCDGYSLKSFGTMVFASMSYSFVNYDQIKSRNKSMEKKTANTYIHLLTVDKDSLDNAVKKVVDKKQTFSFQLYVKNKVNKK